MKTDAFILGSSYYKTDEGTTVQFYARTRKGNMIVLEDDSFYPYCYLTNLSKGMITDFKSIPFVRSVNKVSLKQRNGEYIDAWKVTAKHPNDIVKIKETAQNMNGVEVFKADINFCLNYLYDKQLGPRVLARGHVTDNKIFKVRQIESSNSTFDPVWTIMSFDIENHIDKKKYPDKNIICIGVYWKNEKYIFYVNEGLKADFPGDNMFAYKTEKEMIQGFFGFIQDQDPDIICGYNSDEYDWPHIGKRCSKLGIEPKIGRNNRKMFIGFSKTKDGEVRHNVFLPGRVSFDVWKSVRKYMSLADERLGAVGKHLKLGGKFENMNASLIDTHWEHVPGKVLEYCMRDAELTLQIASHERFFENANSLAEVCKLPFEEVKESKSSRMVDSTMIRAFQEEDFLIPMHDRSVFNDEEDEDDDLDSPSDKVEGAYIMQPTAGLYKYVGVADVMSMYPSQMIQNNVCWTTLADDELDGDETDEYIKEHFNVIEWDKEIKNKRGDVFDIVLTKHYFWKPKYRQGIIPKIMKSFIEQRKVMKSKRKGDKKDYYNRLQNAMKVGPLNSSYGVLLSDFYRFSDKRIGESITAYSRQEIHAVAEEVEKMSKDDRPFKVVGSDTDSVFCDFRSDSIEDCVKWLKKVCNKCSHDDIVLEPEKVYKVWFNHGRKKRYCGTIVWKDGQELEDPIVQIKGYEIRRKDGCVIQKKYLKKLLDVILEEKEIDKFLKLVSTSLKTENFNPSLDELVLSTSVREPEHYKNPESEWRVKLYDAWVKKGLPFYDGMRVSYIVTQHKPTTMYEVVIDGETDGKPDLKYYIDRIMNTLCGKGSKPGITKVFGWDRKALRTGMKKSELEDFE